MLSARGKTGIHTRQLVNSPPTLLTNSPATKAMSSQLDVFKCQWLVWLANTRNAFDYGKTPNCLRDNLKTKGLDKLVYVVFA